MRVGIIGAGPAGLTAGYVLATRGVPVCVYEAGAGVGGLARSFGLWNQTVDLGPHRFFSSDRRVNALWLDVVGRDYRMVTRRTRIYYGGQFFDYPLKPLGAFCRLGPVEAARCMASYGKQRLIPDPDAGSFESWVVRRFGRRLFEIFFKSYSEKLWGIPCTALDADFAAQRIKRLSLYGAIANAFKRGPLPKHRTLVHEFAYPVQGTGSVYTRMADAIERHGGHVRLNSPVDRVMRPSGAPHRLRLCDGQIHEHEHVISTMPISLLVARLPEVPEAVKSAAESLRFRNTVMVYLHVDSPSLFPDQWLYIHTPALRVGRITNFRNWAPELYGDATTSILALEYWANDDDPAWRDADPVWIARGKSELAETGLIGGAAILDGHVVRIPRCYPVYERGYKSHLTVVQDYLRNLNGLQAIGRYGAFKYNNQDHSILMGIHAAENILDGCSHDLWAINTDYENYQEAAYITAAGLLATEAHH